MHNVKVRAGREKAIEEAVRVLRPGGRLLIADLMSTRLYQRYLTELGMLAVPAGAWAGGCGGAALARHEARIRYEADLTVDANLNAGRMRQILMLHTVTENRPARHAGIHLERFFFFTFRVRNRHGSRVRIVKFNKDSRETPRHKYTRPANSLSDFPSKPRVRAMGIEASSGVSSFSFRTS